MTNIAARHRATARHTARALPMPAYVWALVASLVTLLVSPLVSPLASPLLPLVGEAGATTAYVGGLVASDQPTSDQPPADQPPADGPTSDGPTSDDGACHTTGEAPAGAVVQCIPLASPEGGALVDWWEDGSAGYADGWGIDPDGPDGRGFPTWVPPGVGWEVGDPVYSDLTTI